MLQNTKEVCVVYASFVGIARLFDTTGLVFSQIKWVLRHAFKHCSNLAIAYDDDGLTRF